MVFLLLSIACLVPAKTFSQSVYAPLNKDYYHLAERYEIKYGKFAEGMHTHIKPFERKGIAQLADSISLLVSPLSRRDRFNLEYLRNDNWEWTDSASNDSRKPILGVFYDKKSDLYQYRSDDFEVHINPVLYLGAGVASDESANPFINTRGVEVRGMIAKKIGFYTFMTDNQATFPEYVRERINFYNAVPGEGYWKRFKQNGVDFFTARGYITFSPVKPIQIQFGHDKNFIGNGYRSMILSDFSNNYLFLKINTRVWRFNYTNLFAQMNADIPSFVDAIYPKKYFAFHHLSINVGKNLNLGVFEAVMFGRSDSTRRGSFDLNYLNPIIFYRSIEQQIGSEDNALLGVDFKWNFLRRFSVYGQLMLDEFLLKEIRAGNGWWANKQAGQIGIKYIDVAGIPNLDLQLEANIARPYTYSHESPYTSYTHYNQPLAHPLGANFYEYIGIVRYQPLNRLSLTGKLIYAEYGGDSNGQNWGGNVLLPYQTKVQEYGNEIGQGVKAYLAYGDFTASYQLRHNLFIDARQIVRRVNSSLPGRKNTAFASLALRWNIPQRQHEF
ncbi:capsule assembly Wzi family protein [Rhodocytophaga rosea]|uniref:Capsule assembly Wzi family protein n=1 Tax=Rhodocytophaga rosea TaxID=2704465 RepID=A0A6C0GVM3_9BACT|nr:capsule assembly Wzi family protein [Rhodocytophaga rosea]